jgi:hypothetical protein
LRCCGDDCRKMFNYFVHGCRCLYIRELH